MSTDILNKVIELYSDQLFTFGYLELPKFYQPSSFKERIDMSLVSLVQLCPKLDTLVTLFFMKYLLIVLVYLIIINLKFCTDD